MKELLTPLLLLLTTPALAAPFRVTPDPVILNPVSPFILGQFLESASWAGETGCELMIGPDGQLRNDIVTHMRSLDPQIVRFPGGSSLSLSADFEWTHLIDNAPNREEAQRPATFKDPSGGISTTRMGYDEFMDLRNRVPFEPILVTEFADALMRRESLKEAARDNAAAMVAYFNGHEGEDLPDGLESYVQARIANGRREPYGVRYFQVGNEWFITWMVALQDDDPENDPTGEWAAEVFIAYVDAMRAVDPSILIIADGDLRGAEKSFFNSPGVAKRIDLVAHHSYWPMGGFTKAFRGADAVDPADVSANAWWRYWTTGLGTLEADGQTGILTRKMKDTIARGFPLAITEWNWNGWKAGNDALPAGANPTLAMGIGAAGFVHGMIRSGQHVSLATQSMMVGNGWNIAAIRAPEDRSPFLSPQGQVMRFFRENCGRVRIALEQNSPPMMNVPAFNRRPQDEPPAEREAAVLDMVATADPDFVYLHILHRDLDGTVPVEIDISRLGVVSMPVRHLWLEERSAEASLSEGVPIYNERDVTLASNESDVLRLECRPRTINVIRIPVVPNKMR